MPLTILFIFFLLFILTYFSVINLLGIEFGNKDK